MIPTTLLLDRERDFWKGDPEFYRNNLTENALMVFDDPVGVLTRDLAIEAISATGRWVRVEFEHVHLVELDERSVVLTYAVEAEREGEPRYRALASSAYVQSSGSWLLAFHQQTPRRGPAAPENNSPM